MYLAVRARLAKSPNFRSAARRGLVDPADRRGNGPTRRGDDVVFAMVAAPDPQRLRLRAMRQPSQGPAGAALGLGKASRFAVGRDLPLASAALTALFWPWGLAARLIYPLQFLRRLSRLSGPPRLRMKLAGFEVLTRFAECVGVLKFWRDRLAGRSGRSIEYK